MNFAVRGDVRPMLADLGWIAPSGPYAWLHPDQMEGVEGSFLDDDGRFIPAEELSAEQRDDLAEWDQRASRLWISLEPALPLEWLHEGW